MASALGSRVESVRNSPLVRFSINFIRSFGSSSSSSAVSSAQNPKKSKRRKKNLLDVAEFLSNWGIGYHMAKTHWNEVSDEITKINLYKILVVEGTGNHAALLFFNDSVGYAKNAFMNSYIGHIG